jgi:hypothetical protein
LANGTIVCVKWPKATEPSPLLQRYVGVDHLVDRIGVLHRRLLAEHHFAEDGDQPVSQRKPALPIALDLLSASARSMKMRRRGPPAQLSRLLAGGGPRCQQQVL